jgi:hypothetical protein
MEPMTKNDDLLLLRYAVKGQSKADRLGLTTTQPVEALNGTHDNDFSELRNALHKPLRQPSSTGRISQADHIAPNKDSDHIQNDRGRCRLLVTPDDWGAVRRYWVRGCQTSRGTLAFFDRCSDPTLRPDWPPRQIPEPMRRAIFRPISTARLQ